MGFVKTIYPVLAKLESGIKLSSEEIQYSIGSLRSPSLGVSLHSYGVLIEIRPPDAPRLSDIHRMNGFFQLILLPFAGLGNAAVSAAWAHGDAALRPFLLEFMTTGPVVRAPVATAAGVGRSAAAPRRTSLSE